MSEGDFRQAERLSRRGKTGCLLPGLAVVGALAALALLVNRDLPRARSSSAARRAQCRSNLKQLGLALHLYAGDHGGQFPADLLALSPKYVTDSYLYYCPVARRDHGLDEPTAEEMLSYVYVSGLRPNDPPDLIIAFDEETNHADHGDGVNVLFVDGRAERVTSVSDLHARLEAQAGKLRESGRTMEIVRPPAPKERAIAD